MILYLPQVDVPDRASDQTSSPPSTVASYSSLDQKMPSTFSDVNSTKISRGQAVGGCRTATTNDNRPVTLLLLSDLHTGLQLVSINA